MGTRLLMLLLIGCFGGEKMNLDHLTSDSVPVGHDSPITATEHAGEKQC